MIFFCWQVDIIMWQVHWFYLFEIITADWNKRIVFDFIFPMYADKFDNDWLSVRYSVCLLVYRFTTGYVLPVMTRGSLYVEGGFDVSCIGVKRVKARPVARVVVRVQDVGVSSAGTQSRFLPHSMAIHVTYGDAMVEVGCC